MEFVTFSIEPRVVVIVVLVMAAVMTSLCLLIILSRMIRRLWSCFESRNVERDIPKVLEWLATGDPALIDKVSRTRKLRDHIADMAKSFRGVERERLMMAYTTMGFAKQDFKLMQSVNLKRGSLALLRCRNLMIPIPDDGWIFLLRQNRPLFRWAVMEYLIELKGANAFEWLLAFLHSLARHQKGAMLHLISCMAKKHPDSLINLLESTSDEVILEQSLRVLAVYPLVTAQNAIIRRLNQASSKEILVAGIRALVACPTEEVLQMLLSYRRHAEWTVRLMVAQGLSKFGCDRSISALDNLSLDVNYHVRRSAIKSLMVSGERAKAIISAIQVESGHPSHLIANEWEQLHVAA